MTTYLFSYGTLRKEKTQVELFGRRLNGFADRLRGYSLARIEINDETFLAKGEENIQLTAKATGKNYDIIEGTVLEITQEELLLADKYEPNSYKRILIKLESGKESWIYLVIE